MGKQSKHGQVVDRARCPSCAESGNDTKKDNLAIYESGYVKCFACGHYSYDNHTEEFERKPRVIHDIIEDVTYKDLTARAIDEESCRHFDYGMGMWVSKKGKEYPVQVASYKDANGNVYAQKLKSPDKLFFWTGDNEGVGFYGQHLYKGGKKIVVTEGEIDAISVAQVIGTKWPVVSLPNGADSAELTFKQETEWLGNFEEIVLFFDDDEPGRQAVDAVAKLFPGKVKSVNYPAGYKDANDLLKDGKDTVIKDLYWNATDAGIFEDIIDMAEVSYEEVSKKPAVGYDIPFTVLNESLKGLRKAELTLFTAGSGIGKSTIVAEIAYALAVNYGLKFGNMFLEESIDKTIQRFIALHYNINLGEYRKDPSMISKEQYQEACEIIFKRTGMVSLKHFGSMQIDKLINKLELLALGKGVDFIVLDHISMVVSGLETNDERKDIDRLMTALRSFIERTGVGVIAIVHLKRPSTGGSFNEGKEISLSDLRGSASLEQLTDNVIAAERDQQNEDTKHVIKFRILKCREFGDATGVAGYAEFVPETGRLINCDAPGAIKPFKPAKQKQESLI